MACPQTDAASEFFETDGKRLAHTLARLVQQVFEDGYRSVHFLMSDELMTVLDLWPADQTIAVLNRPGVVLEVDETFEPSRMTMLVSDRLIM